jgi:hypothetical protein
MNRSPLHCWDTTGALSCNVQMRPNMLKLCGCSANELQVRPAIANHLLLPHSWAVLRIPRQI